MRSEYIAKEKGRCDTNEKERSIHDPDECGKARKHLADRANRLNLFDAGVSYDGEESCCMLRTIDEDMYMAKNCLDVISDSNLEVCYKVVGDGIDSMNFLSTDYDTRIRRKKVEGAFFSPQLYQMSSSCRSLTCRQFVSCMRHSGIKSLRTYFSSPLVEA